MSKASLPYDQRLARWLVRPLARTRLQPNHLTLVTVLVALVGAVLLASGDVSTMAWGASLFVLSRFLDHFDGELARQSGRTSQLGYVLDYLAGGASYFALFFAMGWGLRETLHGWVIVLAAIGCVSAALAVHLNMQIDQARGGEEAVGYPALAGFELEDGIYLLAPIAWLDCLAPFFVCACVGAGVYLVYTVLVLRTARGAPH